MQGGLCGAKTHNAKKGGCRGDPCERRANDLGRLCATRYIEAAYQGPDEPTLKRLAGGIRSDAATLSKHGVLQLTSNVASA